MEQSIHIVNTLNRDKKREVGTEEERETGIERKRRKHGRIKFTIEKQNKNTIFIYPERKNVKSLS